LDTKSYQYRKENIDQNLYFTVSLILYLIPTIIKIGGTAMKLLFVEDDREINQMLKGYLAAENYEVVCAVNGEEACEKFDQDGYDLVLLDLMIPKISGMEVMQYIRQSSTVPIIIVSAKDT